MGYIYTVISVLLGATKGYCGKTGSRYMQRGNDAVLLNTFRMLICSVIGFFLIWRGGSAMLIQSRNEAGIVLLSAVSTSLFVISWMLCAKVDAYVLLDVFLLIGTVIPITVCSLLFKEKIRINQIIAICILLIAIYLLYGFNTQLKGKMTAKSFLLLLFCGAMNGFTDLSQKLYIKTTAAPDIARFQFYTYLLSFAVLLITYFCTGKTDAPKNPYMRKMLLYVLIMAVCLFGCSYFKTLAAGLLDSAQLYPLSQGLALILSSLMSVFLFNEKLSKRAIFGLIFAFISLLILNLN